MVRNISNLVSPCHEHVMLLYQNDKERNEIAISYINDGLKRGKLAIYASVEAHNTLHILKLSSRITGYADNVRNGNLFIVTLKIFYERALAGDLEPFRDFKLLVEEILRERIASGRSGEAVVVADCADSLSRDEKFDECIYVERWWQDTYSEWQENKLKITVICPHPSSILDKNTFVRYKQQIARQHSLIVAALTK